MKKFLTLVVFLFSSSVIAEVFYCVEDDAIGWQRTNNLSFSKFETTKFIVNIDFNLRTIESDHLDLDKLLPHHCYENRGALNCIDEYGMVFIFNKNRKDFVTLRAYLKDGIKTDDIFMTKGQCESFN
tara:strand:- start:278 stop:658 length:381 start_codon:yes stop_codon:yes gene_type:complete